MRLNQFKRTDILARPEGNKRTIADGAYTGITAFAELAERESTFSDDGFRVVLNIKVEVEDENGDAVDLYIAPNYTWSKKGKMIKILEKLDVLPAPGEFLSLEELVGIPVQVIVENVEKDGETYSNIVSIKRVKAKTAKKLPVAKVPRKRKAAASIITSEDISDIEEMFEDEIEEIDEIDDIDEEMDDFEDDDDLDLE